MPPILRLTAFLLLSAAAVPPARASGQSDSARLEGTLASWAEDAWLRLLDRDAARDGRLSDRGILQRFNSTIDPDYQVNLIRARFGPLDDADWARRPRGARYWGGSINTRDFAEGAEFKESVALSRRWSADVRYTKEDLPELTRSLVRIGFVRRTEGGFFSSIEGTLVPLKPSSDLEVGAGWRPPGGGGDRELALYIAVLDAFNDLIYQDLKVLNAEADTALDYERQPVTLRSTATWRLGTRWRVEGRGGVMLPATLRAYVQFAPDSGFRQAERYGFAGVLVEWHASERVTLGGFATYLRAVTDRTPLPNGRALDDFRLTERTMQVGSLLLARVAPDWVIESWLGRNWRPERRTYRTGAAPDVNYEDVAWSGQATLARRPARGFTAGVTYELDLRDVTRGAGQVPAREASLGRHNNEARVEFGWRAATRYAFELGLGIDLDPGIWPRGWFGGGHGRFVLYW